MADLNGAGKLKVTPHMKQFEKMYFDTYSDAEIWKLNTSQENDGVIRKEAGRYYIFVEKTN